MQNWASLVIQYTDYKQPGQLTVEHSVLSS